MTRTRKDRRLPGTPEGSGLLALEAAHLDNSAKDLACEDPCLRRPLGIEACGDDMLWS